MRIFTERTLPAWDRVFGPLARNLRQRPSHSLMPGSVLIEAAFGDLIDKITILEIKSNRIRDPEKLLNVRTELEALLSARDRAIAPSSVLRALTAELRSLNEMLWNIEDELRHCEQNGEFGPRFVELARSVYKKNDQRAAVKRKINDHLGSRIIEEKSF
jgi:uncharacterized protein DUF6165